MDTIIKIMIWAYIIAALLFGTFVYYGCSKDNEAVIKYTNYKPIIVNYTGMDLNILDSLSLHRNDLRLSKVIPEQMLTRLANEHSMYMIDNNKVNHDNFNKREAFLVENNFKNIGEVVGYGYNSAIGFIRSYSASEPHRVIIEKNGYKYIGISTIKDSLGRNYNTIIFSK